MYSSGFQTPPSWKSTVSASGDGEWQHHYPQDLIVAGNIMGLGWGT